jgi:hypothetical protein
VIILTIKEKKDYSPGLKTIKMVEEALKNSEDSIMKISELKRKLPKQINHNVLKAILEYLEESRKIYVSLKGITWVHNTSIKMKRELAKGTEYFPEN